MRMAREALEASTRVSEGQLAGGEVGECEAMRRRSKRHDVADASRCAESDRTEHECPRAETLSDRQSPRARWCKEGGGNVRGRQHRRFGVKGV